MKVWSSEKPEVYAVSGQELRIHWDIQEVTKEGVEGPPEVVWQANEALCSVYDDRSQLIEKIIGSVLDTSAEIAKINNKDEKPDEYAEYQSFRNLAKSLADGWVSTK